MSRKRAQYETRKNKLDSELNANLKRKRTGVEEQLQKMETRSGGQETQSSQSEVASVTGASQQHVEHVQLVQEIEALKKKMDLLDKEIDARTQRVRDLEAESE